MFENKEDDDVRNNDLLYNVNIEHVFTLTSYTMISKSLYPIHVHNWVILYIHVTNLEKRETFSMKLTSKSI